MIWFFWVVEVTKWKLMPDRCALNTPRARQTFLFWGLTKIHAKSLANVSHGLDQENPPRSYFVSYIWYQPAKSCPSLSSDIDISIWGKRPGDKLGNETPECTVFFVCLFLFLWAWPFCILAHSYSYIQKLNTADFSFFWTSFFPSISVKSTQSPQAFLSACVHRWLRRTGKSWPLSARLILPPYFSLHFFFSSPF